MAIHWNTGHRAFHYNGRVQSWVAAIRLINDFFLYRKSLLTTDLVEWMVISKGSPACLFKWDCGTTHKLWTTHSWIFGGALEGPRFCICPNTDTCQFYKCGWHNTLKCINMACPKFNKREYTQISQDAFLWGWNKWNVKVFAQRLNMGD